MGLALISLINYSNLTAYIFQVSNASGKIEKDRGFTLWLKFSFHILMCFERNKNSCDVSNHKLNRYLALGDEFPVPKYND